jgi:hypothetical protein
LDDLPQDPAARHEAFVDIFGQQLFSLRNQRLASIRQLLGSPEMRARLATLQRSPYEAAAVLDPSGQDAALELATTAIDLLIQDLLALLQNIGTDVRLGADHALRYRLYLEVIALADEDGAVVADDLVNRGSNRALESYFGRWLNRYGNSQSSG